MVWQDAQLGVGHLIPVGHLATQKQMETPLYLSLRTKEKAMKLQEKDSPITGSIFRGSNP